MYGDEQGTVEQVHRVRDTSSGIKEHNKYVVALFVVRVQLSVDLVLVILLFFVQLLSDEPMHCCTTTDSEYCIPHIVTLIH